MLWARGEILLRRLCQPVDGLLRVAGHADAIETAYAQITLGGRVALLGGQKIVFRRLDRVLIHTGAVFPAQSQAALRPRIALVGGLGIELHSPDLVLLHACAHLIAAAQGLYGPEVAGLRRQGEPVGGLNHVAVHPVPLSVPHAQVVLYGGISQLCLLQHGLKVLLGLLHILHGFENELRIDKDDVLGIGKLLLLPAVVGFGIHLLHLLSMYRSKRNADHAAPTKSILQREHVQHKIKRDARRIVPGNPGRRKAGVG